MSDRREKTFVKNCLCPHCTKKIEVVVRSDMRYDLQVEVRKPKAKTPKKPLHAALKV